MGGIPTTIKPKTFKAIKYLTLSEFRHRKFNEGLKMHKNELYTLKAVLTSALEQKELAKERLNESMRTVVAIDETIEDMVKALKDSFVAEFNEWLKENQCTKLVFRCIGLYMREDNVKHIWPQYDLVFNKDYGLIEVNEDLDLKGRKVKIAINTIAQKHGFKYELLKAGSNDEDKG